MSADQPKKTNPLNSYVEYSNMGIEMGVIIAIGVFGGLKLDEKIGSKPTFTVILSLAAVAIAMYLMIRTISKKDKKRDHEQNNTH